MMNKNIIYTLLLGCFLLCTVSCDDEKFTDSIFIDPDLTDETSATYVFDNWLKTNYLEAYNLDFRYKLQDAGSDMDYNLVPTKLEQSKKMAILIKYLWFDVYAKVVNEEFLKMYGPRIIHLIGSAAYNPSHGTMLLGTAEGGIKISLYRCNELDLTDLDMMNEYYFQTMHHEFAHILHQKKTYPKVYETYSAGHYDPMTWYDRTVSQVASLGFVTPYGSSQPQEDFVEIIANYIVKSDAWWDNILTLAAKPGVDLNGMTIEDNIDGYQTILTKLQIARDWLKDSWSVDIDALRAEVQERQKDINRPFTNPENDILK